MTLLQRELKERYIGYSRLPAEYQEVEYIESSGTQWIDTGLIGKSGYKIDLKYYTNSSSNLDQTIVGCSVVNGNTPLYLGINYSSGYMGVYFNYNYTWHDIINSQAVGNTYEGSVTLRNGNQNVTLNGNTVYSATDNLSQTGTTNLFLFTSRGTFYALIKLYYMKIYDENDNLIRDFVPCYRKQDTVIGLYDLVNGVFYTNSGTGTFTKGNDVLFKAITEVYIGNGDSTATKIRPSSIEAQFDFRTLSLSDLSSQGRLYDNIARLDSNGFMTNTSSSNYSASLYCPINISEANHVYLKWTGYFISGSRAGGPSFGLNSTNSRDTGYRYIGNLNLNTNNSYKEQSIYLNSANVVAQQIGVGTGDYTIEFDIDLTTGLTTVTRTGPTTFTQSYTLSASELSTLKSGTQYIITTVGHGGYQAHRVYTMEYLIS